MKQKSLTTAVVVLSQLLTSCATYQSKSNTSAPRYGDIVKISDDLPESGPFEVTPVKESRKISNKGDAYPASPVENIGGEDPWTTWSNKGSIGGRLVLKHIRDNLLEKNLHDPNIDYSGYKPVDCSKTNTNFRSADGTCTDPTNANVGAAGVAFGRNVSPEFIDKEAEQKIMTPNPSDVSKEFFTRDEFKPIRFLNMLSAVWIQFMNHDWLTHGKNLEQNPRKVVGSDGKVEMVERTKSGIDQSKMNKEFGKVSANDVTHWWDASQIYGSSQLEQNQTRSFSRGKMRTAIVNGREILPKNAALNVAMNKQNQGYEVTGFRDNWWLGLSMLHTLFVKEHNAIADQLLLKNAQYDHSRSTWIWKNGSDVRDMTEKQLDEQIFQTARLINAAILAKIHTVEWTPAVLPNATLKKAMYTNWYGMANPQTWSRIIKHIPGFNKTDMFPGVKSGYLVGGIVGDKRNNFKNETNSFNVPYSITEEFTSVYRLHSLLPENIELKHLSDPRNIQPVPFVDTRNEKSYGMMENNDLKDLYYSFGTQLPGQLVLNDFPKFMQELQIPGHGVMDLGMVDILRDRERGTPRYNQFRRAIGLKPIKEYRDFFPGGKAVTAKQQAILAKFNKVYGTDGNGSDNVELVDLLVGTLAEEVRPKHFGFGETMFQIFILMASRRLMADRFFTDDYRKEIYTQTGLDWIDDEGRLSQVIVRHMPELKDKVRGLETAFLPWRK